MSRTRAVNPALHFLFFLSGAAALGYQLVWTKMFAGGIGHEYSAVLAIVAAFMAGMAAGALASDRFIPRSPRAGLWFAGLELFIGGCAFVAAWVIPKANDLALHWIGLAPGLKHWFVAFVVPAVVVLPATAAIGATLPAMEKFLSVIAPRAGSIGSIYAANTLGAVAGTLLSPHLFMPRLGLTFSCGVLATFNVVAGMGMLILARSHRGPVLSPPDQTGTHLLNSVSISPLRLGATLFLTGLLGIGFEVFGVRVLNQVLEGTIYTYASVLAVFLGGTAAGAAVYHRWWRGLNSRRLLAHLMNGTAVACAIGVTVLGRTEIIYEFARRLGDRPLEVMFAELITAGAVFVLPTFCMGALFSHLLELTRLAHGQIGKVVALNTLGAALAPVVAVAVLPHLGTKWSLVTVAAVYATLVVDCSRVWLTLGSVAALVMAMTGSVRIIDVPPGGRILDYREGVMASVAVIEDAEKHRTLRVDNRFQMGGTAAADAEYRQAHIPLLLHPGPANALFLGIGTGISLGAASLHANLRADGVELVPEVVAMLPRFAPANFSPVHQAQLHIQVADARRYVRVSNTHYDVIVGDLFHPYRDGAGALYTREHFGAVRERLNTNGLFCQWLPMHQLDETTLRVIVRTFLEVFPDSEAWLLRMNVDVPVVGLVGRRTPQQYSERWIENRAPEAQVVDALKRLSLGDSVRFFGSLIASAEELRKFSSAAAVNTDDRQQVTFMAPRLSYQRNARPHASLFALLDRPTPDVKQVLHLADRETPFAARVTAFMRARDVYLRGLILYSEGRRDQAIAAYIESARLSEDFTAGYAQCLSIASLLARSEPAAARDILQKLIDARPERPVARELLLRLATP